MCIWGGKQSHPSVMFSLLFYPAAQCAWPPCSAVLSVLWRYWKIHCHCELTTAVPALGCASRIGAHTLHTVHCTLYTGCTIGINNVTANSVTLYPAGYWLLYLYIPLCILYFLCCTVSYYMYHCIHIMCCVNVFGCTACIHTYMHGHYAYTYI